MSKERKHANSSVPLTIDPRDQAQREDAVFGTDLGDEEIAALAYELWQARGCPDGSPDEDWYRAVEILRSRT
jgi:hypothetical protein